MFARHESAVDSAVSCRGSRLDRSNLRTTALQKCAAVPPYHESRKCSRDTYSESYITKYTSIRRFFDTNLEPTAPFCVKAHVLIRVKARVSCQGACLDSSCCVHGADKCHGRRFDRIGCACCAVWWVGGGLTNAGGSAEEESGVEELPTRVTVSVQ